MQFAQLLQSGAYWCCVPGSFSPSFISHATLHSPRFRFGIAPYPNPLPRNSFALGSFRFAFASFSHPFTSPAPHPPRLLIVCPPPAGRPVLCQLKLALRAVWQSAACGCLRSFLTPIPRVRGGMAVVADAPHIHSSCLLFPVLRCHKKHYQCHLYINR